MLAIVGQHVLHAAGLLFTLLNISFDVQIFVTEQCPLGTWSQFYLASFIKHIDLQFRSFPCK